MTLDHKALGLDVSERSMIRTRWRTIKTDAAWECFEDFLLWCVQSGYHRGYYLRKRNEDLPHSPENSYWLEKAVALEENMIRRAMKKAEETGLAVDREALKRTIERAARRREIREAERQKRKAELAKAEAERQRLTPDICIGCEESGSSVCINGCVAWREQFIENWNKNIHRRSQLANSKTSEAFRYEHPDRVREDKA